MEASNARKKTLDALVASGYRITKPRTQVVTTLARATQPLTIKEIAMRVKADEVSVYRTVAILRAEGLIEEIVDARGRHRFALHTEHHHHIVCEHCGRVAHVPCGEDEEARSVQHPEFNAPTRHEVTYFSTCRTCRA